MKLAKRFCFFVSVKVLTLALVSSLAGADRLASPAVAPENQVFQFMATVPFTNADSETQNCSAYLWIPPKCVRVRGVLVAGRNVTEHLLVGHPAIRAACDKSDLAILWCCPTFFDHRITDGKRHGEVLERIVRNLADVSGYAEVATAPWLPIGESWHLVLVRQLVNIWPERCIAGVAIKANWVFNWTSPEAAAVPVLTTVGTCYEWDQQKADLLTQWKTVNVQKMHQRLRAASLEWPGSLAIEAGTGHFDCSEAMTELIAKFIVAAARARLPEDVGAPLRPVNLNHGFVAGLPLPGAKPTIPTRYQDCPPSARELPWYFDEELAKAAYDMADVDWTRKTQIPTFATADGRPAPFGERGIVWPIPFATEDDGITFSVHTTFLEEIPQGFVGAGTQLGHAPGTPVVEWISGNVAPVGGNRFRIALSRTWPDCPTYLIVGHPGDTTYRPSLQPGLLVLTPNRNGQSQQITFDRIPDQVVGEKDVELIARSDAGLKVQFFVRAGPAEVRGGRLLLTAIPPRARLPLAMTVAAWQWGRVQAPAVQTADIVEQSFLLRER